MKRQSRATQPAGAVLSAGRRQLLRAGISGTGLALLGAAGFGASLQLAPRLFAADSGIEALLLSCMDYRLANEVTFYMNERGLTNQYDQVVLAGASLGVATDRFPAWAETFWKHLELALQLHQVKRVIALDHRDCGAFQLVFGQDFAADHAAETAIHTRILSDFREQVRARYPSIEVELLLMALDGRVEGVQAAI